MSEGLIEIRYVAQRGGSISLNIPSEIARKMDLTPGYAVVFQYDDEKKQILIEKVHSVNTNLGRTIEMSCLKQ